MGLTLRQKKFCDEYLKDLNATRAAIKAGYSVESARSTGSENLTKPDIKEYVEKKLKEAELGAEESVKLLSDIAKGNLSDYLSIKRVEHTPRVEVGLESLIKALYEEIELEEEFATQADLFDEELERHRAAQDSRQRQILRYTIQLKKDPAATKIVDGKPTFIETVEVDLIKLMADKEKGKIKSITPTPHGYKIELFSAETAIVNIAKIHGLFAKDNEQSKPEVEVNVTPTIVLNQFLGASVEIKENEA